MVSAAGSKLWSKPQHAHAICSASKCAKRWHTLFRYPYAVETNQTVEGFLEIATACTFHHLIRGTVHCPFPQQHHITSLRASCWMQSAMILRTFAKRPFIQEAMRPLLSPAFHSAKWHYVQVQQCTSKRDEVGDGGSHKATFFKHKTVEETKSDIISIYSVCWLWKISPHHVNVYIFQWMPRDRICTYLFRACKTHVWIGKASKVQAINEASNQLAHVTFCLQHVVSTLPVQAHLVDDFFRCEKCSVRSPTTGHTQGVLGC